MTVYEEEIIVEGIRFQKGTEKVDWHYDCCYHSVGLPSIEGLETTIFLFVGNRENETDFAWTSELSIGSYRIYVDAQEYYFPEHTVKKALAHFNRPETVTEIQKYEAVRKSHE